MFIKKMTIEMSDTIFKEFEFHHIGLLVPDLEEAINNYTLLFGRENISEIFTLESQKVKECFVKNGINSYIGLVSPSAKDSVVNNLMKKGISYYHLAYKVKNINDSIKHLENLNYKTLELFSSEAFGGKLCVFLYTPDAHLIELIEE
jgi:catechol 2,3-dioxygenase-like lactoylglutathione lyase family enzyme